MRSYQVSLKVNTSNNLNLNCRTNNIGVLFSTIAYKNPLDDNLNTSNPAPINNFAHVYSTMIVSDTVNWITVSGSFIADSAYSYIIIGNFFDNQHTSQIKIDAAPYCFIDDICLSTDSMTCMGSTGIKEQALSAQLTIFPNPYTSIFSIKLPIQHSFALSITDITGRIVYTNKNAVGTITIDASGFSTGVYFVKATNERTVLTGKLIKE